MPPVMFRIEIHPVSGRPGRYRQQFCVGIVMSENENSGRPRNARPIVVVGYLIFGIAWILIGERLVDQLSNISGFEVAQIETVKGLLFVALSGALIFALQVFEARLTSAAENALGSKAQEAETYRTKYEHESVQRRQADIILEALSSANRAIVSAQSKEAIVKLVCDRVAHTTNYPVVWFGRCAEIGGEKLILCEASSGVDAAVVSGLRFSWDGGLSTPNPISAAIKTGNLQASTSAK